MVFEYYFWTKKHYFVLRGIVTMAGATDSAQKGGSKFLAQPSGPCCLEGFRHTGDPRGSFSTIANVETYIVHPESDKSNGNILLYFPDVWGLFTNGLLVMDTFADAGYTVLGLDYFQGVSRKISARYRSILIKLGSGLEAQKGSK